MANTTANRRKKPEKYNALAAQWRRRNPEKIKAAKKRWNRANPDRVATMNRKQRENNPNVRDYDRRRSKKRYWADPEKAKKAARAATVKKKDYYKAYVAQWQKDNSAKVRARKRRYDASKLCSTPPWITAIYLAQIQEFYDIAVAIETQTGIPHHVDHIHALQGVNFRGLHVPWNLQVLPAKKNLEKNRRAPLPSEYLANPDA